jgi:hypothetical protein
MTVEPSRIPAQQPLRENERVVIKPDTDHPWGGSAGTAVCYERYGPRGMFHGWRVKLDSGRAVYATVLQLEREA